LKACKDYDIADWSEAEYDSKTQFPENFKPEEYGLKETTRGGQPITTNTSQQSSDETYINIQKALREIKTSLQKRQGQGKFREDLIECYKGRCAITGCKIEGVLEAAHVKPYCISKENKPENGILLRADLHTLFDLNLIIIHPGTLEIEVSQSLLNDNEYEQFNNIVLPSYEQGIFWPDDEYLEWRYKHYEEHIGKSLREIFKV
jgi:predicted restriction endonuclease